MVDPAFAWLARLGLAGVFVASALHKWRDLRAFASAVAAHRLVPEALSSGLAPAFAALETAVATGLLWPPSARAAGCAAAALLALYSGAIAINLARGRAIDCGCSWRPQPVSRGLLARNALLVAAVLPAALPIAPRELLWIDALSIAAGVGALAGIWLAAQALVFSEPATARLGRSA
jgi:hypothetical protein